MFCAARATAIPPIPKLAIRAEMLNPRFERARSIPVTQIRIWMIILTPWSVVSSSFFRCRSFHFFNKYSKKDCAIWIIS